MVGVLVAEVGDGMVAGALGKVLTIPFECVLTPLSSRADVATRGVWQAVRSLYARVGWRGFSQGAALDLWRGGIARGLTIGLFEAYRHNLGLRDFEAGALTGATVTLLTYPLEVLQTGRRSMVWASSKAGSTSGLQISAGSMSRGLVARRGIVSGLYPALLPSLFGYAGFWGVQFACREPIMELTSSSFATGFLGSTIALTAFNWNNCVRLTMQRRAVEGLPHVSWVATLRAEYRLGGFKRFYVGFGIRILQTGFSMGAIFSVYDHLRLFRNLHRSRWGGAAERA